MTLDTPPEESPRPSELSESSHRVSNVSLGGSVQQRPTAEVISSYTGQFEPEVHPMCRRVGCDRAATVFWTEKATGESLAYCPEDGIEAFNLVTRWLGEPEQRLDVEKHSIAVERAVGRGLYDQPMRWQGSYDDDDRTTKR